MKEVKRNDITILTDLDDITEDEIIQYSDAVIKHNGGTLKDVLDITVKDRKDGTVDISYDKRSTVKFERIRRVTGYLSNVDNWNDGKRAELAERVRHA